MFGERVRGRAFPSEHARGVRHAFRGADAARAVEPPVAAAGAEYRVRGRAHFFPPLFDASISAERSCTFADSSPFSRSRREASFFAVNALQPMISNSRCSTALRSPRAAAEFSAYREIGRASCRARVCQYVLISVVAESLKK